MLAVFMGGAMMFVGVVLGVIVVLVAKDVAEE